MEEATISESVSDTKNPLSYKAIGKLLRIPTMLIMPLFFWLDGVLCMTSV